MRKEHLYIFNPEHDLALASGEANYIAPASARKMAEDLALLPIWYAEKGDGVLASSAHSVEFLEGVEEVLGVGVRLVTPPELAVEKGLKMVPWGWDVALRKHLWSLGVEESELPTIAFLERLRTLSHRSQAARLLPKLRLNDSFCGESFYLCTQDDCKRFVEGQTVCLLKAPLSGSGKGLNWCKGVFTSSISDWCARVIALQGGVIGEPIYNKVEDFAMEFRSDGEGKVVFVGYSLFHTSGNGMYAGNQLWPDEEIMRLLSGYVPLSQLLALQVRLEEELTSLLGGFYDGCLGVDMMICHFPDEDFTYRIHPCVEINLRMNMGIVAHSLREHYLAPDAKGVFQIDYHPQAGQAWNEHQRMRASFPLCVENGRIRSGYLPLVPVTPRSCYRAWVLVDTALLSFP